MPFRLANKKKTKGKRTWKELMKYLKGSYNWYLLV